MNILILNWRDPKNPKSGGAEIVTMQHAKGWVKAGYKVVWFTSMFPKAKEKETLEGVAIIRQGNTLTHRLMAPIFYHFSHNTFDVVIDEVHGLPYFTPLFVRAKKVVFIHEIAGVIWDYMYPFPVNLIGKLLEKAYLRMYRNMRFWTDASSTVDELVAYGILRKNCLAIACPASNSTIITLPKKEKNPTYIFVSRLVKMKGIEVVLEAFTFIQEKQRDAQLWIVGSGDVSYQSYLNALSKKLHINSCVIFWGKVSESKKLALMGKAHLLLHASVKEGWGLVVLEAASQGTPSVVYKVSGLVDSVQDGKTGIIVKENTPRELADSAEELLNDFRKYKNLQREGLKWVQSLSWGKATRESIKLLHAV